MRRALVTIFLLSAISGCKERGVVTLELDIPQMCLDRATHVRVYLARGATCDCTCQECFAPCSGGGCQVGCDDCTIDDLRAGLRIEPPEPGQYAVIYQLVTDERDPPEEVALACGVVTVEADGTSDFTEMVMGSCCD